VEGLAEVVVGTEPEAGHSVPGCARRGEHQHHRPVVTLDDHSTESVTVKAWQISVEKNDVVLVHAELGRGVAPVVGDVDGDALVA
jgi:hypothetical protein